MILHHHIAQKLEVQLRFIVPQRMEEKGAGIWVPEQGLFPVYVEGYEERRVESISAPLGRPVKCQSSKMILNSYKFYELAFFPCVHLKREISPLRKHSPPLG